MLTLPETLTLTLTLTLAFNLTLTLTLTPDPDPDSNPSPNPSPDPGPNQAMTTLLQGYVTSELPSKWSLLFKEATNVGFMVK